MSIKTFNEYIEQLYKPHYDTFDYQEALTNFITNKYDIMSFNGILKINPGDTIFYARDYVSNIECNNEYICYVINNKEYVINETTKLLLFLTPLNPIILRNKSNKKEIITFKRWFIKITDMDALLYKEIYDGDHIYYYGQIH